MTLTLAAWVVTLLSFVWVGTYLALGLPVSAAIPFAYQVVSVASLAVFARTKDFRFFRASQLVLILLLPFLLQLSLGGYVASSAVSLWALVGALGALFFYSAREAIPWFVAFLALRRRGGLRSSRSWRSTRRPSRSPVRTAFFVLNIVGVAVTAYLLLQYSVRARDAALASSERLLLNVLPAADRRAAQARRGPHRRGARRRHGRCSPTSSTSRRSPSARRPSGSWASSTRSSARSTSWPSARPREDQDHRRRLHGRRRAARATAGPRRGHGGDGARHAGGDRPASAAPRARPRDPDRDGQRPGRRRRHRPPQVHLRPVGRHGEHREPDGVARPAGPDPGHRGRPTSAFATGTASRSAARSRSRARDDYPPTCWWGGDAPRVQPRGYRDQPEQSGGWLQSFRMTWMLGCRDGRLRL